MLAGIREILITTNPEDRSSFERLLHDVIHLGSSFQFITQKYPEGLARASVLIEKFISEQPVCLILGDNVFCGSGFRPTFLATKSEIENSLVWSNFDDQGRVLSVEEKPIHPKSHYAITGSCFYDYEVRKIAKSQNRKIAKSQNRKIAKSIQRSARSEYEITSINEVYLIRESLDVEQLGLGFAWLDTGTPKSLLRLFSSFIQWKHDRVLKSLALRKLHSRKAGFLMRN